MAGAHGFVCLALGTALLLGVAGAGAAEDAVRWEQTDETLALRWQGQLLWRLNYGADVPKPYFDPVAPAGGPSLSWNAPPDHPWHHGLWFSWKYLNGVNYWEEEKGASEGQTRWGVREIRTTPEGAATIDLLLRYLDPQVGSMLVEARTLEVTPPEASGAWHLDWLSVFTATREVLIDRTPITGEPGGQSWGGYAGLSLRMPKLEEPRITADAGSFTFQDGLANLDGRAVDYSGVIDGRRWGVAILSHPESEVDPTPWYAINQPSVPFHYFSPAVIYRKPIRLAAGEKLALRYRILIHPGAMAAAELAQAVTALKR